MTWRLRQTPIACQKWRVERFRQRNVDGVVCRQIVAQVPDAFHKEVVRIARKRQVSQVVERCAAALCIDFTRERVSAQDLRDLHIEQMRRVQRFVAAEKTLFQRDASR